MTARAIGLRRARFLRLAEAVLARRTRAQINRTEMEEECSFSLHSFWAGSIHWVGRCMTVSTPKGLTRTTRNPSDNASGVPACKTGAAPLAAIKRLRHRNFVKKYHCEKAAEINLHRAVATTNRAAMPFNQLSNPKRDRPGCRLDRAQRSRQSGRRVEDWPFHRWLQRQARFSLRS